MDNYSSQLDYLKKVIAVLLLTAVFFILVSYQKENPYLIYVSAGAEGGNGTQEKPFGSLEQAKLAIRNIGSRRSQYTSIIVEIDDGEYFLESLEFDKRDSGTKNCPVIYKAKNTGKAILNGGVTLNPLWFSNVTDPDIRSRLSDSAVENIVCISLSDLGINREDYGKIGAIGSFHTAAQYDGDWIHDSYCELFYNDRRMTIARYPNEGYITTDEVVSEGWGLESVDSNHAQRDNWYETRNPESDVYKISKKLAERIASWKTTEDVWMFGYWSYDWADASTPIGFFDAENRLLSPKFVALYGARKQNAPFYFFNVFEELDTPGEWYLDRENGVLYLYPFDDFKNAEIMLSISTRTMIKSSDVEYLTIDGFVVEGTRKSAMRLYGNNVTVSNCLIKNIGSDALYINGRNNLAFNNEITRTGKSGITLEGGSREELIPGENVAENNLIHDWSEVYLTYCPAIVLNGVGNVCKHNEIFNSPHTAIIFSGNDHVIEFNDIHDVCLLSSDAGAIYAGRHWDYYGNRINYNYIHEIGSEDFTPNGIYLDDNLSGITVIGNIVSNVKGNGLLFGGGRDLDVENNLLISCGKPILYDARAILGVKDKDYWYANGLLSVWNKLYQSPWKSEIWQNAYPQMARFIDDDSAIDDPDFVPNPAYSTIINNVEYRCNSDSRISEEVLQFSEITKYGDTLKALGSIEEKIFADADNGDYRISDDVEEIVFDDPNIKPIPFSKIGRQ